MRKLLYLIVPFEKNHKKLPYLKTILKCNVEISINAWTPLIFQITFVYNKKCKTHFIYDKLHIVNNSRSLSLSSTALFEEINSINTADCIENEVTQ